MHVFRYQKVSLANGSLAIFAKSFIRISWVVSFPVPQLRLYSNNVSCFSTYSWACRIRRTRVSSRVCSIRACLLQVSHDAHTQPGLTRCLGNWCCYKDKKRTHTNQVWFEIVYNWTSTINPDSRVHSHNLRWNSCVCTIVQNNRISSLLHIHCLSIHPSIHPIQSIHPSVCLSIYLSIYYVMVSYLCRVGVWVCVGCSITYLLSGCLTLLAF